MGSEPAGHGGHFLHDSNAKEVTGDNEVHVVAKPF